MTIEQVRNDLHDIRFYYANKKLFEEIKKNLPPNEIEGKAIKYSLLISEASPKLYLLYSALYVLGKTQVDIANEWCMSIGSIKNLSVKLNEFLHERINKEVH